MATVVADLHTIASVEAYYRKEHGRYGSLEELVTARDLPAGFRDGMQRHDHVLALRLSERGEHYAVAAWKGPGAEPGRSLLLIDGDIYRSVAEGPAGVARVQGHDPARADLAGLVVLGSPREALD